MQLCLEKAQAKGLNRVIKLYFRIIFFYVSLVFCCRWAISDHSETEIKSALPLNSDPIRRPEKKQKGGSTECQTTKFSIYQCNFCEFREFIAHRIVYSSFIDRKNWFGVPIEQPPNWTELNCICRRTSGIPAIKIFNDVFLSIFKIFMIQNATEN